MTDFAFNPSQAALRDPITAPKRRRKAAACRLGYAVFLILNVILFIRPSDLVDELQGMPIYETLILFCAIASLPAMLVSLSGKSLAGNPALTCVLGLLPAIVLANLSHLQIWWARVNGIEFLKVLIYFVLLVSLLNTRARMDRFLVLFVGLIVITAGLSLLTYHGVLDIPGLQPCDQQMGTEDTGEIVSVPRLVGPGIFNDPNDFSTVLVAGLILSWKFLQEGKSQLRYPLLVMAAGIMGFAFVLTRSRGGLLSLIAAAATVLIARYGWKRAALAGSVLLPALFLLGGARQTNINLDSGDTAQGRIHLWRDSLVMFHHAPVFGIGAGQLEEVNGLVAHNSYVQVFAELGIFGGILFIGAIYVPAFSLIQQCRSRYRQTPHQYNSTAIALLALLVGYLVGLYSLTRIYTVSTYVILGVVIAGTRLLAVEIPQTQLVWTRRLAINILIASFGCLLWLEAFVRIFVS